MFNVTTINPVALAFTLLMCVLMLAVPRRLALLPILLDGTLVTELQRVVVAGLDFTMLRLLLLAGVVRILLRREQRCIVHSPIDTAIIVFCIISTAAYVILRGGTTDAWVNHLGLTYNTLGLYFIMRCTIRDRQDVLSALGCFSVMCGILAISMVLEQVTGRNFFWVFGGVPEFTPIRDGALRSQGAFPHPLLAGAFGASLLPVFYLLSRRGHRALGRLGMLASVLIAVCSKSSGPMLALLAGTAGLFLWRVRDSARSMRWMTVLGLVCVAQVMKAPVWALVERASLFEASTAYHRFALIDQAIKRFGEWWFLGTVDTGHWGWGLWDVTNQYLAVGVDGGLAAMIAFIAMMAYAFGNVGRAVRGPLPADRQYLLWAFGSTLFAHAIAFIGMAYFGAQIYVNFYFILAVLALGPQAAEPAAAPAPLEEPLPAGLAAAEAGP